MIWAFDRLQSDVGLTPSLPASGVPGLLLEGRSGTPPMEMVHALGPAGADSVSVVLGTIGLDPPGRVWCRGTGTSTQSEICRAQLPIQARWWIVNLNPAASRISDLVWTR